MAGNLDAYQYLKAKFTKPKVLTERTVFFNQELPEDFINHKTRRAKNIYENNKIRTTKYTPFSFFPKNLLFQFSNIANVYFLVLIILGCFQIFGVQSPGLAAVPLIVIVIVTAVKDAIEDSRRTISDLELNNNPISILKGIQNHNVAEHDTSFKSKFNEFNASLFVNIIGFFGFLFGGKGKKALVESTQVNRHSFETINSERFSMDSSAIATNGNHQHQPNHHNNSVPLSITNIISRYETRSSAHRMAKTVKFTKHSWKDVKVGDIVRLHNNEEAPADLIIISTSDEDNKCFVETKNLDGETNLKARKSIEITSALKKSRQLETVRFKVRSEAPSLDMYHYHGSLSLERAQQDGEEEKEEEAVNIDNLILRGSSLKNTKWVIGFVLFTGHESKIMLNSGITPTKKSRISQELNTSVFINFGFLFLLCLISGILNGLFYARENTSFTFFEYDSYGGTPVVNGILSFFVAMILYQALVPISLYISVEIIKTLQALFIYHDVKMYYEPLDYPCTPKTWNISDDLGQIEYIFSDKTGTLTQNIMEFRKATVNGKQYGLAYTEAQAGMDKRAGVDVVAAAQHWEETISKDKEEMIQLLKNQPDNSQFQPDKLTFVSSEFVKDALKISNEQSKKNEQFLLYLSLCHTALTEENASKPTPEQQSDVSETVGRIEFKAESPDEAALVQFACDFGYVFTKRTRNGCIINCQGVEREFEILKTLEFNSARKRMSVIVKFEPTESYPEGKIMLITKGADSMIYSRLSSTANDQSLLDATTSHLEEFANEGLRTLCLAGRELNLKEFNEWLLRYNKASNELTEREEKMDAIASELESDLVLYGGTAIEDRLQVGVPESIEKLGRAGIKLWILTGDKIETAINIGFSCNLLANDMELLVLKQGNTDIDGALTENLSKFNLVGSKEELVAAQEDHSIPSSNTAIIVDGFTLTSVFADESLSRKFLLLCKQCKSVICCRVSPSQKAQVVKLVRDSLKVMALAIGDGANDVSMIQTANIGVGIVGEEGRQAAMSSDYAICQFKYLERLILVHGRWDYKRLAEMIPIFFYKNVCFTLTLFWYGIFTNFDGTYLLEFTMITFYNLAFTSLPVIFLGCLDQDVEDDVALKFPQLYKTGILRLEWNQWKFVYYMLDGLYQSAVSFFFPYLIFYTAVFASNNGLNLDQRFWIGTYATNISVTSVNLYALMRQYRWDWVSLLVNALSSLVVFFWCGVWSSFIASSEFYKNAAQVYGSLSFWACFFVGVVINLTPRLVFDTFKVLYWPKDIDIIRECVKKGTLDDEESGLRSDNSISEGDKSENYGRSSSNNDTIQ